MNADLIRDTDHSRNAKQLLKSLDVDADVYELDQMDEGSEWQVSRTLTPSLRIQARATLLTTRVLSRARVRTTSPRRLDNVPYPTSSSVDNTSEVKHLPHPFPSPENRKLTKIRWGFCVLSLGSSDLEAKNKSGELKKLLGSKA
jgi:hypothetical protein